MKTLQTVALALLIGLSGLAYSKPVMAENPADDLELIAVRMYADWCGYCKELDSKLDEIKTDFEDTGVWFTYFDITDDFMHKQTRFQAAKLDLTYIYEEYHEQTGIMLLVNPENGEVIDKVTSEPAKEDIKAQIKGHL